mgnify:CR=1 FL=1
MTTYNFRLNSERVDLIRAILVEFEDCGNCRPNIEFTSADYYVKDIETIVTEIKKAIQEAQQTN